MYPLLILAGDVVVPVAQVNVTSHSTRLHETLSYQRRELRGFQVGEVGV